MKRVGTSSRRDHANGLRLARPRAPRLPAAGAAPPCLVAARAQPLRVARRRRLGGDAVRTGALAAITREGEPLPADPAAARGRVREDDDETPEERVTVKGKKKKFDPVKKAWEKARVAREEREAQKKAFLEEKARRAAALDARRRTRRDKTNLMRKKTKRGQPVMKHRVQSILDKLTADASS